MVVWSCSIGDGNIGIGLLVVFLRIGRLGYPTDVRGSGTGWAACFGRIGAFVAPFIVPLVYASFGGGLGFTVVFIMLASAFAIVALVIALFGIETKERPLTDISNEEMQS